MSGNLDMPLASGDLEAIAAVLSKIDADTTGFFASPLVGRIEIYRPDTDTAELIGHLAPYDDWYGFIPIDA